VALSHVEANLSVPSERTVILLAGVFALEPHQLTDGTDYPRAKAERLPLVAARHTEAEHQLAVLSALLDLLDRLPAGPTRARAFEAIQEEWSPRLRHLATHTWDPTERHHLEAALHSLHSTSP
jgi:hypothetical protein